MPRKLLVWGDRDFSIEIPDDAKVTFGPFSPPTRAAASSPTYGSRAGTLRIYKGTKTTENVIAVFAGVEGFREESLKFEVSVAPPPVTEVVSYGTLTDEQKEELAGLVVRQMADKAMAEEDDEEEDDGPLPGPKSLGF